MSSSSSTKLSLSSIRETLIRQEDTIIFALIERAQYAHNEACYSPKDQYASVTGGSNSLLDFMLVETERLHARVRRYVHPDEHAFFPHRLPAPQISPVADVAPVLHPCNVSLNPDITDMYLSKVLPSLCKAGDDEQHGSSVVADIAVLQAISKRVHYGFYVAESKFQAQEAEYTRLIEAEDEDAIMELLTNAAVEERVLRRVHLKASTFGRELDLPPSPPSSGPPDAPSATATPAALSSLSSLASSSGPARVDPDLIAQMYREHVIPLTKVAEVRYLLQRLSECTIAYHGPPGSACERLTRGRFIDGNPSGKRSPLIRGCASAADVFGLVQSNSAHQGVILMESGQSGLLHATRTLLETSPLRIVGELVHRGSFALVSKSSLPLVQRVRGRPEALQACSEWLRRLLSHAAEEEEVVSAQPATPPWEGLLNLPDHQSTAYIVEADAPLDAGLKVLAMAPLELGEYARCVIISKPRQVDSGPSGHDKTMLLFRLIQDQIGSLATSLAIFNTHEVNVTFIQSYSDMKGSTKSATFFMEVDGHWQDAALSAAIEQLHAHTETVKLLGSFAVPISKLAVAV